MTEEQLTGGRTSGAIRVGDTVRRPDLPWSGTVRSVLDFLHDNGFDAAPRSFGLDAQGRDVQSYLPGRTVGATPPWPAWVWSDTALQQVGRWMRNLHDVTARFVPPVGARWFAGQSWHPGLVIGHHDVAPYNAVWSGDRLVGFYDWSTAGPSSRELDLAYAALFWVPLHARRVAQHIGFRHWDDRHRRLHLFLDAYGMDADRTAFRTALVRRVAVNADTIRNLARTGDPIYTAMLPDVADLDQAAAEIAAQPADFWRPAAAASSSATTP